MPTGVLVGVSAPFLTLEEAGFRIPGWRCSYHSGPGYFFLFWRLSDAPDPPGRNPRLTNRATRFSFPTSPSVFPLALTFEPITAVSQVPAPCSRAIPQAGRST